MDLVFDVGHAETAVGCFVRAELRGTWKLATDARRPPDEYGLLLKQMLAGIGAAHTDVRSATIGAAVPAVARLLETACRRHLDAPANHVTAGVPLPLRLAVDDPAGVSAARIANAVAAHRLYRRRDVIVVDLGTSTTYDCVGGDGVFAGGAIAPGVKSAAESLAEYTAQFPDAGLHPPERVVGRRLAESVLSGVFYGAVDAVEGMVRRIRDEWGRPDALVVATGGLADVIGPHCRGIAVVEPHLTLHGLKLVHDHHARRPR